MKRKIVILDGFTVNPGDLNWKPIEQLGDLKVYDRSSSSDVYERAKDAEIIVSSKIVFNRELFSKLTNLKYLGIIATGYNVVDLEAAREFGITVTNVRDYSTKSVAQMVYAHIFELYRRVAHHNHSVKYGNWSKSPDFCYWDFPQQELTKKTLGLLGFGNIGKEVAKISRVFDMKVNVFDPIFDKESNPDINLVDLDTIFKESDIVSLHCPLTETTRGMINSSNLKKMKSSSILINTSRGPLVNDSDLRDALENKIIAGAGLDVLSIEPPTNENPLFKIENCLITPHIAWSSKESREILIDLTAKNIEFFLKGDPINVVS